MNLHDIDYSSLSSFEGLPVVDPVPQSFGDISSIDSENAADADPNVDDFVSAAVVGGVAIGMTFPRNKCLVFNVDSGAGDLEGFGFNYGFDGVDGDFTVTIFDSSNNVVDTIAPTVASAVSGADPFVGWNNCNGADVARIELCSTASQNLVLGGSFSFNAPAADPTCQDMLQDLIDDLNDILPNASADDQFWIEWAITDLTSAQDPTFWDTEDRLSDYGTGFFSDVFWATYDLECVCDEVLVEGSLIGIQDLLGCVVDNEIEYALENNANQNLIAYAEFFESYAEAYSEAGMYLQAVILHFYAWLLANCS